MAPPAEESQPRGSEDTSRDNSKSVTSLLRPESYNELSPLMTTMLEDELKNIMIKIWQILPDEASNEAEKLVLDKLKDAAGDDLRNAIGLNITKRLLNVHTGILVKIQIYSDATPSEMYAFAKKYRIVDFKHVQGVTYAGRLRNWTHLDDLFTHKNLKCGTSNVTITPIYNFLKCPASLRTVFDGQQNYSQAKQIEIKAAKNMKNLDAEKITADKVLAEKAKEIATKDNSSDKGSKDTVADNRSSKDGVADNNNSKDPVTKIEVRAEPKNTQSTTKGTTDATKNNAEKSTYKTVNNQSESPNIDKKITSTQSNETKTQTKVTKLDKPKMLESKPENAVKKDIKIAKVVPAKTVANKPSVTNTPQAATNSPKVAINAKASSSTPKATTNTTKSASNTSKPATTTKNDEIRPTPKKEILPAKPNEMKTNVKSTNVVPSKATVKEATKSVANKPTTTNPAKKTVSKPSEVKKPEVKATKPTPKVKEPTKITSKPFANIPKKELLSRQAEIKKFDTKITKNVHKTVKSYKNPTRSIRNSRDKKNEGDFDELSDRDILALLSSGIVLDECSGSD